jgi:hypothetical protein
MRRSKNLYLVGGPAQEYRSATLTLQPTRGPNAELGRGKLASPPWVIGAVAAVALVGALVFVALLIRKRLRDRRGDLAPISSRGSVRPPPSSRSPR